VNQCGSVSSSIPSRSMITDQDSPGKVGSDLFPSTNARDVVITSALQRFRFESKRPRVFNVDFPQKLSLRRRDGEIPDVVR